MARACSLINGIKFFCDIYIYTHSLFVYCIFGRYRRTCCSIIPGDLGSVSPIDGARLFAAIRIGLPVCAVYN